MSKNTICLWYEGEAETAARFYAATFPDSAVGAIHHAPDDYPGGKAGDALDVAGRQVRTQLDDDVAAGRQGQGQFLGHYQNLLGKLPAM